MVYNSRYNFIVLVNYTEDFFFDMIEFMSAVIKASAYDDNGAMVTAMTNTFIDETPEPDDENYAYNEPIRHNLYYTLLGGSPEQYAKIYQVISSYSNPILQAIQDDIYEHCSSSYFKDLIDDGILDIGKFKHSGISGDYSTPYSYDCPYRECTCDNAADMLKNTPEVFTGEDLLPFIKIYLNRNDDKFYATADILLKHHDGLDYAILEAADQMYKDLLGENYKDNIEKYAMPAYLRADDEEPVTGEVPISDLDEAFQQDYEKFTGVYDDHVEYMDIDEVVDEELSDDNTN
jgi:hypothetical protein